MPPIRYVSDDEDSARWDGFDFRDGDVVVSARSKSGTTWVQFICAMLVRGRAELPEPLGRLSPWLDHTITARDQVFTQLARQSGRRVIKTHTPLDGIVLDPRAHYVVAARHPLDAAVSLYHQADNLDRDRIAELTGKPAPSTRSPVRPDVHDWLVAWIRSTADPYEAMDSLPGVLAHLSDAWARRDQPNVTLVHYADLSADLDATMRRLAARLECTVDAQVWPDLVAAASFGRMRANPALSVPNAGGVLKDPAAFFRRGRSGAGREVLSDSELRGYLERVARAVQGDLLEWLHR